MEIIEDCRLCRGRHAYNIEVESTTVFGWLGGSNESKSEEVTHQVVFWCPVENEEFTRNVDLEEDPQSPIEGVTARLIPESPESQNE